MQVPFYILGRDSPKGRTGWDRLSPRSPLSTHTSLGLVVIGGHFLSRHRRRSSERSTSAIGAPPTTGNQSRTPLSRPASLAVPGRRAHHSRDCQPAVPRRFLSCFACYFPVTRGFRRDLYRKETAHHTAKPPQGGLSLDGTHSTVCLYQLSNHEFIGLFNAELCIGNTLAT
jgi:hypothetical protein